jgi:hypothetical protein
MEYLKINKSMQNSNYGFWWQFWEFIKDNTIQAGLFALIWRGIDRVFKYASDSRDERIRRIVREELNGKFEPTEQKLDELTKLVYERLFK